eukprot:722945-Rhodomonas_salina.1
MGKLRVGAAWSTARLAADVPAPSTFAAFPPASPPPRHQPGCGSSQAAPALGTPLARERAEPLPFLQSHSISTQA